MPIEIRELIIKTTVEKRLGQTTKSANTDELKKEILAACKLLVKKVIKENKER